VGETKLQSLIERHIRLVANPHLHEEIREVAEEWAGLSVSPQGKEQERCPSCGYTKEDALIHCDHRLCKNAGKAPWEVVQGNETRKLFVADWADGIAANWDKSHPGSGKGIRSLMETMWKSGASSQAERVRELEEALGTAFKVFTTPAMWGRGTTPEWTEWKEKVAALLPEGKAKL
jgi:hypothetical protein